AVLLWATLAPAPPRASPAGAQFRSSEIVIRGFPSTYAMLAVREPLAQGPGHRHRDAAFHQSALHERARRCANLALWAGTRLRPRPGRLASPAGAPPDAAHTV